MVAPRRVSTRRGLDGEDRWATPSPCLGMGTVVAFPLGHLGTQPRAFACNWAGAGESTAMGWRGKWRKPGMQAEGPVRTPLCTPLLGPFSPTTLVRAKGTRKDSLSLQGPQVPPSSPAPPTTGQGPLQKSGCWRQRH